MSAYSTLKITRSMAIWVWREHLLKDPSDEELESFMDRYLESRLYNCRLVSDDEENDNDLL